MRVPDYLKALGVAVAALAITLAASFPMVAFYAYFIEPGRHRGLEHVTDDGNTNRRGRNQP